jgi:serine phosphatase RsbU (regulator of sigma subunit)
LSIQYFKYKIFICLIYSLKICISTVYGKTYYYTTADFLSKQNANCFFLNNNGLSGLGTNKVTLLYVIIITLIITLLLIYLVKIRRENKKRELIAKQILEQKEELIIKNKNITDSIIYAKRIQSALMPPDKLFNSLFPDSFVLHIPKDIVSGDFYWLSKVGDRTFVAAVDCTGHGVPGAFMSIIGIELFRNITSIEGIKQPAQILTSLNKVFQKIFHDQEIITFRDGMDLAFCSFDNKNMQLEYAGAFNPLYLIRDNNISEYKGDRFSVGLERPDEYKTNGFKNHEIPLKDGDVIYIFSDGYADQFGGPEGKKYKYRRFRHLLLAIHQLPMAKQHEYLEKSILNWKGSLDQVDDILVIGVRIHFNKIPD